MLPASQVNQSYYYTINAGYAFMNGFRINKYWKNTTQCFDRITNLTYIQYPNLTNMLSNSSASDFTKLNLTTYAITNTSATGLFCNSMLRSATGYWNDTIN